MRFTFAPKSSKALTLTSDTSQCRYSRPLAKRFLKLRYSSSYLFTFNSSTFSTPSSLVQILLNTLRPFSVVSTNFSSDGRCYIRLKKGEGTKVFVQLENNFKRQGDFYLEGITNINSTEVINGIQTVENNRCYVLINILKQLCHQY